MAESLEITLPEELIVLLKKVANDKGLTDMLEVVPDGKTSFFEGYTSVVYFVTVKEPSSNKVLNLVAKLAINEVSEQFGYAIRENYHNECLFYKEIWPTFENFQMQLVGKTLLDVVPTTYYADETMNKETIIMENLKAKDYVTFPRHRFYDKQHLELFFQVFGQYHALSFVYKYLMPKGFRKYSSKFKEVRTLANKRLFKEQLELAYRQCNEYCENYFEENVLDKLKSYTNSTSEFFEILNYQGDCGVFAHGDCWSNNLMFKYDENNQPISMKLIDFQDVNTRSTVHDLSYNFYSGASSEELHNISYYLDVYHKNLCDILKIFKIEVEKVYPFKKFKAEWMQYCKFGFTMSLLLTKLKFAFQGKELALSDIVESDRSPADLEANKYDVEQVKQRYREIVRHFYDNDFL